MTDQDAKPVLIVMIEDDEGHARLIEKHIRRAGMVNAIIHFRDGASALAYLLDGGGGGSRIRSRCLILLDLNLPDMSGVDVLTRLKSDIHLRRLPTIVLTTADDPREIQLCYDLGANAYITKPTNSEDFSNAIRQLGLFLSVMQIPEVD